MHTHSYYELLLVNEGEISVRIELDGYERLLCGDTIFIPPFVPHGTYREKEGKMRCTVVKFSPSFLSPAELTASDVGCLLGTVEFDRSYYLFKSSDQNSAYFESALLRVLELVEKKELFYETALRGELSSVFVKLLRVCDNRLTIEQYREMDSARSEALRFVLEYVRENYQYPISMEELADKCDMSYYAFSRFFKQATGKGFSEHLLDTRLSYAQKALLSEGSSVSEIAAICGFEYVSYFIKKFKQKYGVTPLEYRKMYRGEKS